MSNRSTMVSYEKIIRRFLKFHLVFKWELFVSFCVQMVPPFLFHVLQCSVLCWLTLVLLSMDSYETATTDNGLKNQLYMNAWPVSWQLVEFQSKDQSPPAKNSLATATRLIKHKGLAYICVEQTFLYSYIYNTNLFGYRCQESNKNRAYLSPARGLSEPELCNQIRYTSERNACH